MRTVFIAMAAAVLGLIVNATSSRAEITYPWCAQYGGTDGGGNNCGFVTLEQCRMTVSGMGGYCYVNLMHRPSDALAEGARRPRR